MSAALTYRQRVRLGLVQPRPRKLDYEKARDIRRRYFSRQANQPQLAAEYGVTQHLISRVVSGQIWNNPRRFQ